MADDRGVLDALNGWGLRACPHSRLCSSLEEAFTYHRGLGVVEARLQEMSRPVADHKQRVQLATISAHNDSTIGEIVAGAPEKIGVEGTTSVEEAKGTETTVEVVEGMRFDRG